MRSSLSATRYKKTACVYCVGGREPTEHVQQLRIESQLALFDPRLVARGQVDKAGSGRPIHYDHARKRSSSSCGAGKPSLTPHMLLKRDATRDGLQRLHKRSKAHLHTAAQLGQTLAHARALCGIVETKTATDQALRALTRCWTTRLTSSATVLARSFSMILLR